MVDFSNTSINNIINTTNLNTNKNNAENIKAKVNNAKDDKELKKACQEFESLFVHMLLKEMRSTVPEGGFIEKSTAREMFEDMYDQEIAKHISKTNDGVGLAKVLYEQMKYRGVY